MFFFFACFYFLIFILFTFLKEKNLIKIHFEYCCGHSKYDFVLSAFSIRDFTIFISWRRWENKRCAYVWRFSFNSDVVCGCVSWRKTTETRYLNICLLPLSLTQDQGYKRLHKGKRKSQYQLIFYLIYILIWQCRVDACYNMTRKTDK